MADKDASTGFQTNPQAQTPQNVLVVDDNLSVLKFCELVLKREGYNVVSVENAFAAILATSGEKATIHLALLDVTMPNVSGHQLLDILFARNRAVSFVMMSGEPEDQRARVSHQCPYTFLPKPFTSSQLLEVVRHELALSTSHAA